MKIEVSNREYLDQPEGEFQGVLSDVEDLGLKPDSFGENGVKHKLQIRVESARTITEQDYKDQGKPVNEDQIGKPYIYTARYNVSLGELSNYGKLLRGWGVELPTSGQFDDDVLIGRNGMFYAVKEPSGWVGIKSVRPLPAGVEPITVSADYVRVQDRDESFEFGANATAAPAGLG